jgi:hypothetical protein
MRVRYEVFESSVESWHSLFDQAARFASRIGPSRLINISQSAGQEAFRGNNGVVTVWYWDEGPEEGER